MLELENVTLYQINCVDSIAAVNTIKYSIDEVQFKEVLLFSDIKPDNLIDDITFHKILKLTHDTYNKFTFKHLSDYITTDFCLCIGFDGFIINPHLWEDTFFDYDYIGAPWPVRPWNVKNRVGNGGFCLKSKKLIELSSKLDLSNREEHDDVLITNTYMEYFINNGCRFAPIDVAARFSLEMPIPEVEYDLRNCFGFHGMTTEESEYIVRFVNPQSAIFN